MPELAILIPTVNRADKLVDVYDDLVTHTTASFRVYFVMEEWDADSISAVEHLPSKSIVGDYGSCAAAYNAGFDASCEPYVFLSNDDVQYPEGWQEPALHILKSGAAKVVGVNEGHGRMTCFSMVERAYIEEHSGVYDKPSTLVHPYASQYVDTELADYAKVRGVWAEAPEGGVIHAHWEFGLADRDHPNYRKVRATLAQDWQTYSNRKIEWERHERG